MKSPNMITFVEELVGRGKKGLTRRGAGERPRYGNVLLA